MEGELVMLEIAQEGAIQWKSPWDVGIALVNFPCDLRSDLKVIQNLTKMMI